MPLDRIPVYVRAGAVIPLGPAMQYTAEKPVDPLSVQRLRLRSAGYRRWRRGHNEFSLYEDDGISTDYQNGKFQRTRLRFRQSRDAVRFEVEAQSGDGQYWSAARRAYRLQFHGLPSAP